MPLIHFATVSSPTNVFARPARKHTAAALLVSVLVFPTAQGQELAITSPKAREVMDQCIAGYKKTLDEKLAATQDPARIERLHKVFEGAIQVCYDKGKIIQNIENKEASIATKEASIAAIKQDTENKKANIERLRAERAESQKAIAESQKAIAESQKAIAESQKATDDHKNETAKLEEEMAKVKEAGRVSNAFYDAAMEYVRLVREGGTPAQIEAARTKAKALQEQVIPLYRDLKDPRFHKSAERISAIKF